MALTTSTLEVCTSVRGEHYDWTLVSDLTALPKLRQILMKSTRTVDRLSATFTSFLSKCTHAHAHLTCTWCMSIFCKKNMKYQVFLSIVSSASVTSSYMVDTQCKCSHDRALLTVHAGVRNSMAKKLCAAIL